MLIAGVAWPCFCTVDDVFVTGRVRVSRKHVSLLADARQRHDAALGVNARCSVTLGKDDVQTQQDDIAVVLQHWFEELTRLVPIP